MNGFGKKAASLTKDLSYNFSYLLNRSLPRAPLNYSQALISGANVLVFFTPLVRAMKLSLRAGLSR